MNYIHLGYTDLALAALLVVLNGLLSVLLDLGLERRLAIAAVRMMVQLTLVGLVLTTLFALVSPLWTGLTALAMVLFAGYEILARQEKEGIVVEVIDEGPGVSPADLSRIFEKFFRSSAPPKQPGTGLGLSIARGLMEGMGGAVEAHNRDDGRSGLVVRIRLPVTT